VVCTCICRLFFAVELRSVSSAWATSKLSALRSKQPSHVKQNAYLKKPNSSFKLRDQCACKPINALCHTSH